MKYFFTLIFFFANILLADEICIIETKSKIYHLGLESRDQPLPYLKSNCAENINKNFINLILNSSGVVAAQTLANQINENSSLQVKILPERVNVFNLKDVLKSSFELEDSLSFNQVKITDQSPLLFEENEWIEFSCNQCQSTGEKNILITITNSFDGKKSARYLNARINAHVKALVASTNLRVSNQPAKAELFHASIIDTDKPEHLFTDLKTLGFFRLNRPLVNGEALKHSDLTPAPLVQPGTQATVTLISNGLSLTSLAMPLKSARYGETVQLRALDSNRIILGKVIDFNKVEINL